jgi:hypothetical protein
VSGTVFIVLIFASSLFQFLYIIKTSKYSNTLDFGCHTCINDSHESMNCAWVTTVSNIELIKLKMDIDSQISFWQSFLYSKKTNHQCFLYHLTSAQCTYVNNINEACLTSDNDNGDVCFISGLLLDGINDTGKACLIGVILVSLRHAFLVSCKIIRHASSASLILVRCSSPCHWHQSWISQKIFKNNSNDNHQGQRGNWWKLIHYKFSSVEKSRVIVPFHVTINH